MPTPTRRQRKDVQDEEQRSLEERGPQKKARRKGKLWHIVDMPLDILYEVFQHLQPLDLLHTARTTKALRKILMSRSSKSTWEVSFSGDPDVPPCPPDMSLPAWARLLYDQHCYAIAVVRTAWWGLRIRLCMPCSTDALVHKNVYEGVRIENLVPNIYSELDIIVLIGGRTTLMPNATSEDVGYLKSEADWVVSVYKGIMEDEEALQAFKDQRYTVVQDYLELDRQCRSWAERKATERSCELRVLRTQRRDDLLVRLASVGWEEEIAYMRRNDEQWSDFIQHNLVYQARPLTDRVWAKARGPLEAFMQECKTARLKHDAQQEWFREARRLEQRLAVAPAVNYLEFSGERFACTLCATEYNAHLWEIPCMNQTAAELHITKYHANDQDPRSSIIPLSENCANSVRIAERYATQEPQPNLGQEPPRLVHMDFAEIEGLHSGDSLLLQGCALTMRGRAGSDFFEFFE
ncbi:hypothetical protein OE88DRAFT_1729885 [Heliocybe sulcata]|uniref:F-box domain-containing protein n=1 Tax=Heliocybe sulcata TaxID=5364 RepID=A0A5C3NJQ7_9AGAM|nr:hypothetical protein OE88DRAFT_1729885 [Heliocybe sulcata]